MGLALDGTAVLAQADNSADVDWFRLTAPVVAGGTLTVATCPDPGTDLVLRLYRQDPTTGTFVYVGGHNGPSCAMGGDVVSTSYVAGARYFVRVSNSTPGGYSIQASVAGASIDLSDGMSNAFPCQEADGAFVTTNFDPVTDGRDDDWYRAELERGDWWIVDTHTLGPGVATRVEIWDQAGLAFASIPGDEHWVERDNSSAIDDGGSHIAFSAPRSGKYFARVISVGTPTGPYTVQCYRPRRWNGQLLSDGAPPEWP